MTIADKLKEIAENTPKIYEAGKQEGIEQGKQAEYDAFWDTYQDNGNRAEYPRAFGRGWNKTTFQPKYDLKPTNATWMFRDFNAGCPIMDLTEVRVNIDFSQVEGALEYLFYGANISKIGVVDASKSTSLSHAFTNAYQLHTITKLVVGQNTKLANAFDKAISLENIVVEGVIAKSGLNLQWSTQLSKASYESIRDHVSLDVPISITFSLDGVNKTYETSVGANDGSTSDEWVNLWKAIGNVTIALA